MYELGSEKVQYAKNVTDRLPWKEIEGSFYATTWYLRIQYIGNEINKILWFVNQVNPEVFEESLVTCNQKNYSNEKL